MHIFHWYSKFMLINNVSTIFVSPIHYAIHVCDAGHEICHFISRISIKWDLSKTFDDILAYHKNIRIPQLNFDMLVKILFKSLMCCSEKHTKSLLLCEMHAVCMSPTFDATSVCCMSPAFDATSVCCMSPALMLHLYAVCLQPLMLNLYAVCLQPLMLHL